VSQGKRATAYLCKLFYRYFEEFCLTRSDQGATQLKCVSRRIFDNRISFTVVKMSGRGI